MSTTQASDFAAFLNEQVSGFNRLIGLEFVRATVDEVVAALPVTPNLHQPYGLVHGGVYCSLVETLGSVGAGLRALADQKSVVGLENSTSFLRAVRKGTLTSTALPLQAGRRAQVWETRITDDEGNLVATGRLRVLCLEAEAKLAGGDLTIANISGDNHHATHT